jgi:RecB family exonuclease
MRGSIDRIDLGLDGSAEVIDYKTGSVGTYRKLSEDDPHQQGQRLQLFVYGRAARKAYPDAHPIFAHYWFTKDDKRHGYPITEGVETEVLKAMDLIVAGIAGGVFPAHPSDRPTYGWVDCWYCTPDGLSDAEARREWERIRDDPALTGYLSLIDPGDGDDHS